MRGWIAIVTLGLLAAVIYRPGLAGGYLFDDYPNIVDNPGVKPADASLSSLVRVAISSPSSEFKRPLSSLTFGANYLATGDDPYWMKVTNLVIHLLNGLVAFVLSRALLRRLASRAGATNSHRTDLSAAIVAGAWLLLPINLTGVLYVVQRMESLANLFVLTGLAGYVLTRERMQNRRTMRDLIAAVLWIIVPCCLGLMAKETAVMLPLYAFATDWIVFGLRSSFPTVETPTRDRRLHVVYIAILWLPMVAGLAWILPGLLRPSGWSTRDFTLGTRLLTEARVVLDYVGWTLIPTPGALSFYHDDIVVSQSLTSPWTTLPSILGIGVLIAAAWFTRRTFPSIALGLTWFLACHLLTGTILPLELVYEHRNYFASLGLVFALTPLLAQPAIFAKGRRWSPSLQRLGPVVMVLLIGLWAGMTGFTAAAWGTPLTLARELAARAPRSPRAQYELGRTYIIYAKYDASSPFFDKAYPPLETAAALPDAGILPEQALIFLNARMHRPIEKAWWDSMETKLRTRKVTVQDESALSSLVQCDHTQQCDLPADQLTRVFLAALSHPERSPRLVAVYGDFAWNALGDHELGARMLADAVQGKPGEPAYRITLIRMLVVLGRHDEARMQRDALAAMNVGGELSSDIADADKLLGD
ncbi:hypothetical protein [Luteibacter sp.]|nr:hypothetical protein [Luteibacter sp.]MDQ8049791.1 hypothetical protein [Luteibacter sp.]